MLHVLLPRLLETIFWHMLQSMSAMRKRGGKECPLFALSMGCGAVSGPPGPVPWAG